MLEVTAYKCDYCNTLHSNYFDCINCETSCRDKLKQEQIMFRYNRRRDYIANYPRLNATTIEELERLVTEAYYKLFKFKIQNLKIHIERKELCLDWNIAPMGEEPFKSKRHEGYCGYITYKFERDSVNDMYPTPNKIKGICTKGGDSGRYDLTLFLSDFPLLKIDL